MSRKWLAPAGFAALTLVAAACGSSSPSTSASSSPSATKAPTASSKTVLETRKIAGVTVLTNAKGFTLYWFSRDTSTTSNCNGTCATFWPPVKGPATAGPGVTGKLGTITRSNGSIQATYDGHPLYTYSGDTAPGQAKGNGLRLSGGVWHEVTVSGMAVPTPTKTSSGGYGY
jgi:predicted lipoprotein with Yx(FWY)xxD motif